MNDPESRPLPALANSAFALLREKHDRETNALAGEALAAMGLASADGWRVNVAQGAAERAAAG